MNSLRILPSIIQWTDVCPLVIKPFGNFTFLLSIFLWVFIQASRVGSAGLGMSSTKVRKRFKL